MATKVARGFGGRFSPGKSRSQSDVFKLHRLGCSNHFDENFTFFEKFETNISQKAPFTPNGSTLPPIFFKQKNPTLWKKKGRGPGGLLGGPSAKRAHLATTRALCLKKHPSPVREAGKRGGMPGMTNSAAHCEKEDKQMEHIYDKHEIIHSMLNPFELWKLELKQGSKERV